jgi:vitamin B12 transporter
MRCSCRRPLSALLTLSAAVLFSASLPPVRSYAGVTASGSSEAGRAPADSADAPRYRLDPVVVTGERAALRLDRVPLDVTVVGRERMDAQRSYFLSDALREVPAVDVQRSGNLGKLTNVRLRGADPRHTLVLFDGIPINGPWLGSFDFADLMGTGVRRVEVLGGPSSSLYGSGAVGGVIQILSPAASEAEPDRAAARERGRLRLMAEYGENVTLRQAAQWDGAVGRAPLGFALTRLQSDGVAPRDAYLGWNGNAYVEFPVGPRDRLRVTGLTTHGRKELPYDFVFDATDPTLSPFGSTREIHDPNNDEEDFLIAGAALWAHTLGDAVEVEGEISGLGGRIQNENGVNGGGSTDFQDTDLRNNRGVASLRARLDRGKGVHLLLGGEYRGDHVDREDRYNFAGFGDTTSVSEGVHARALYGQAHIELHGRLIADGGLRVDDHSEYGSFGLPRVALACLLPRTGLKLRAGYGRAFTAPSLTDLYYPGYSSRALKPERSTTWEAGIGGAWLEKRIEARAGWHRTEYHDLIEGVLQPDFTFVPENVGEAEIEGEEYALRLAPSPRIEISGSAAHLAATNSSTGAPLAKRPAWRFVVAGQATPHRDVTLSAAWRWVDSVHDPFNFIDVAGRVLDGDNPGYAALDLGATARLHRWAPLEVNVRVANALDRAYSEVKGFPISARAFTVGLTFAP